MSRSDWKPVCIKGAWGKKGRLESTAYSCISSHSQLEPPCSTFQERKAKHHVFSHFSVRKENIRQNKYRKVQPQRERKRKKRNTSRKSSSAVWASRDPFPTKLYVRHLRAMWLGLPGLSFFFFRCKLWYHSSKLASNMGNRTEPSFVNLCKCGRYQDCYQFPGKICSTSALQSSSPRNTMALIREPNSKAYGSLPSVC